MASVINQLIAREFRQKIEDPVVRSFLTHLHGSLVCTDIDSDCDIDELFLMKFFIEHFIDGGYQLKGPTGGVSFRDALGLNLDDSSSEDERCE